MDIYKFKDIVKVELIDGNFKLSVVDKGVESVTTLKMDYLINKGFEKAFGKADSEFAKVLILALKAVG